MWYINVYNSAVGNIWYAESNDGIHWHNTVNYPVLTHGQTGKWDDYSVGVGPVLKESLKYKIYYDGFHDQYGEWSIGLAASMDGIHWTKKYDKPVFSVGSNRPTIDYPFLMKVGNEYRIYFTGTGIDGKFGVSIVTVLNL